MYIILEGGVKYMGRLIALLVSIIVVTSITIKAFWFGLNGHTTPEIINRLPILFTPATYVFALWLVIIVYLLLWCIKYFKNRQDSISTLQLVLFILTVIFQITSLYNFHNDHYYTSLFLIGLQVITLFGLYLTYPLNKESIALRIPIALYLSRTVFLFILHLCYILVKIQWQAFGLSNALWTVIVLTFGTAIALHLRYHHYDIAFPIVFIWFYIGIAVANGFEELLVTIASLFLSGVIIVGIFFIKKGNLN